MNMEQVRQRVHENPKPFIIRLSDGREFPIPHQDYLALGKNQVIVVDENDRVTRIDALHIVSLDDMNFGAPASAQSK